MWYNVPPTAYRFPSRLGVSLGGSRALPYPWRYMARNRLRSDELEDAVAKAILFLLECDPRTEDPGILSLRLKVVEAYLRAARIQPPEEARMPPGLDRVSRTLEGLKG